MRKAIARTIIMNVAPVVVNSICGIIKSTYKNFDTKVMPEKGSVLYCDLSFGIAEHSGIYVGDNRIVHLNGKGEIEAVSPAEFLSLFALQDIYVSCMENSAVGSSTWQIVPCLWLAKNAVTTSCWITATNSPLVV